MNRKILGIALGVALAFPLSAAAATISDPLFSNGDTTVDVRGNSTVSGTFTLQVSSGEVCEVLRTQAAPQAFTDTVTDNQAHSNLGYQQGTYTGVAFSVKVSPNTGTYYPTVQCAGIWGGNHSVDGADNVVTGSVALGTIRVTANGSSSTGSGDSAPAWLTDFQTQMASIQLQIGCMNTHGTWNGSSCVAAVVTPPPPPPVATACNTLANKMIGTMYGQRNQSNVVLQGYLLSEGESIPALAAGASFGLFFTQTQAALTHYKAIHQCSN